MATILRRALTGTAHGRRPSTIERLVEAVAEAAPRAARAAAPAVAETRVGAVVRSLGPVAAGIPILLGADPARHPLMPAAVRVERGHSASQDADLTALTVWFGDGPELPSAATGGSRSAAGTAIVRLGAGVLAAATLAALSAAATRLEEQRRARLARPVTTVQRAITGPSGR